MKLRLVRGLLGAVVLAVDPADRSGVALATPLGIDDSGDSRGCEQRVRWVEQAVCVARSAGLDLVVAIETWTPHGAWGFKQAQSVAEQAGRWLGEIERQEPSAIVVRVDPGEWRRALFGGGQNRKRQVWKDLARLRARAELGVAAQDDEAEAICIALWAQRSPRVAEAYLHRARSVSASG